MDKVIMFIRLINWKERMAIGIELEDDDGANGLTQDWAKVKRVCRRHDKRKTRIPSATTWPMMDGQRGSRSDDPQPPKEEGSKRKGLTVLDMEVLKREAYETLKEKAETEEKVTTEPKSRQKIDVDEVSSYRLRMNDVSETMAKVRYIGTTREGIEQDALSSCERTMTKNKADDMRVENTTSTVEEDFEIRLFETSGDEGVSIIETCMIKEGKECEAY